MSLRFSDLTLAPAPDKAWEGDAGLVLEALERATARQPRALADVGQPRTWAFRTREGGAGVLRVADLGKAGTGPGARSLVVALQYRLLLQPASTPAPSASSGPSTRQAGKADGGTVPARP